MNGLPSCRRRGAILLPLALVIAALVIAVFDPSLPAAKLRTGAVTVEIAPDQPVSEDLDFPFRQVLTREDTTEAVVQVARHEDDPNEKWNCRWNREWSIATKPAGRHRKAVSTRQRPACVPSEPV